MHLIVFEKNIIFAHILFIYKGLGLLWASLFLERPFFIRKVYYICANKRGCNGRRNRYRDFRRKLFSLGVGARKNEIYWRRPLYFE